MGLKNKARKGEISIGNNNGRIRLRWRHLGERYYLNLPYDYLPENLHYATIKVTEIKLDILKGSFDTTLKKYKPTDDIKRKSLETSSFTYERAKIQLLHELSAFFTEWTISIRNIDIENSFDYLYLRKVLEKWINIPIVDVAQKLNSENWAVTTYNRRLTSLKLFFNWLIGKGVLSLNPLTDVVRRRNKQKKKNPRRVPLSEKEIVVFLEAIRNDKYCPVASRYKHSHYYPFLLFIFLTGLRNAEIIGLKVKHIDFNKGQIEISETFARTVKGTNHASRITKETKTGNIRYLPMNDELMELLLVQVENKSPEELIFQSPNGLAIDDKMLKRRILKPVMTKLEIGDKDLYVARHSFGTRAIQQGMSLTDLAYLMGHTTIETASRNYVDVGKPAVKLPTINQRQ